MTNWPLSSQSYLVIVAFSKKQGTQLPVESCFVSLMAVFGEFVHVRLGQLERLLSQVVLAIAIANVEQPEINQECIRSMC